jgi:RNA polymerase sigma-70 factor, ECF subfamily
LDVSEVNRATLRDLLVHNYETLTQKLARRLGSIENAREALQDTYLRLEGTSELGPIRSPQDYLYRIALNIAADRRRSEARRLTTAEVDALLDVPDDAPGPGQVVEARSELQALARALAELPARRREIFKAVLLEQVSRREIAERFGITVRTVGHEIERALEHGERHLRRNIPGGFNSEPHESSTE